MSKANSIPAASNLVGRYPDRAPGATPKPKLLDPSVNLCAPAITAEKLRRLITTYHRARLVPIFWKTAWTFERSRSVGA